MEQWGGPLRRDPRRRGLKDGRSQQCGGRGRGPRPWGETVHLLSGKGKDGSRGEGRGAETSGPRGTCPACSAHEPPSGLAAGRSNAQRSGERARPTPGRIAFEKPPRSESVTSQLPRPQRSGGRKGRNAVCSALGEGLPVSQTKAPRLREGGQSQGASRGARPQPRLVHAARPPQDTVG